MKITEIENYLAIKNTFLDDVVGEEIEKARQNVISNQDEEVANYCWCLQQIYKIQKGFDKYSYVQLPNQEYNYGMLEILMSKIDNPYDEFHVETVKVIKPEYKNIGRNETCPCGSGKRYKKCHLGTKDELMDHHKIYFSKRSLHSKNRFVGFFGTWK